MLCAVVFGIGAQYHEQASYQNSTIFYRFLKPGSEENEDEDNDGGAKGEGKANRI